MLTLARWNEGPVLLGLVAGAGLPLLLVAGLQWNSWHHRIAGDDTPNPYYWGGVGLFLLAGGMAAYALAPPPQLSVSVPRLPPCVRERRTVEEQERHGHEQEDDLVDRARDPQ